MDIRSQFPILNEKIHGKRLVYLDTAATSLKPLSVIEAERQYELEYCANIHRGVHALSERATKEYEETREVAREFLNARSVKEIIFTTGTTGGINLVASSYARKFLKAGDEIWISSLEHHSNLVPWQMVCEEIGCVLRVIPLGHTGELPLSSKSKFLAMTYASNATGITNPVHAWVAQAKAHGMVTLIDAAQAAAHIPLNVQTLDCDFLVFSGHKAYGPTGTGVLYGRQELLEKMPPYQGGGDMIERVEFEKTTYAPLPAKFEAGTPNISGVIGLKAALKFVESCHPGLDPGSRNVLPMLDSRFRGNDIAQGLGEGLIDYAEKRLAEIPLVKRYGGGEVPIFSFTFGDVHPHDVASILDQEGVAVRAGHLCAQPLLRLLGVNALVRASFGVYNMAEDVDGLCEALLRVKKVFRC